MPGYPGWTPGVDIFGEGGDSKPVAAEFRGLFPDLARQGDGGVMQEQRTAVEPAPSKPGGKRGKRRTVPQPKKPKAYKRSKSTPGGEQMPGSK